MDLYTGIVDTHHSDGVCDLAEFKKGGGGAYIAKCTEGGDFTDRSYAAILPELKKHGILAGLYHFGNGNDPELQATHFLAKAQAFPEALLILDCESNERSSFGSMSFDQAAEFCDLVRENTGRWPVFYTYESMLFSGMTNASKDTRSVLAKCPIWIAKYGPTPKKIPESWQAWKSWDMWQYTSSLTNGPSDQQKYPRGVPGFARASQDRSCFRGSYEDLQLWWKTAGI